MTNTPDLKTEHARLSRQLDQCLTLAAKERDYREWERCHAALEEAAHIARLIYLNEKQQKTEK